MTTTPRIPSAASICWQVTWTFTSSPSTLFLSDFIQIPGIAEKAFRLGAETDASDKLMKLSCYVNFIELARFGFAVKYVTCMLEEKGSSQKELRTLNCVNGAEITRAFFLQAAMADSALVYKEPSLTFRLILSGTAKQYVSSRFHSHLDQQLWTSVVKGHMTDVVFQVGDSKFPAHKFVLAARSPVFRAMFDADMVESRTGEVHIVDVEDPDIFEQFLHFLYSGQLVKPVTKQLGMVAEKYQVETLMTLCQAFAAIEAANDNGLKIIAAHKEVFEGLGKIKLSRQSVDENQPLKVDSLHMEIFTADDAQQHCNKVAPVLNQSFRYRIDTHDDYESQFRTSRSYHVRFHSSSMNALAWRVAAVDLFADFIAAGMQTLFPRENWKKQSPLQVFHCNFNRPGLNRTNPPPISSFRFAVHFVSTVENFQHQLRDSLFAHELWSSRINKDRTDVEFKVGEQTFPAHRALLAAQCPALAALAALIPDDAESSPSSPSIVSIPNMDPTVFENVLYFLYTGLIKDDEIQMGNLAEAAAAFQIETLSSVALESQKQRQVDQEILSEVLMMGL